MPRWVKLALIGVGVLLALWALNVVRVRHAEQKAIAAAMPGFQAQVAQTPKLGGQPRLLDWAWRETGAATGAQTFETIVYDESDEIGRGGAAPSAAWRGRDGGRLKSIADAMDRRNGDDVVEVRSLGGHFYRVTQTQQ